MQPTEAQFFDGLTAGRHAVRVALSDDRMSLVIDAESLDAPLVWPLMDLRALKDTADDARLTLTRKAATDDEAPRDPARLVILDKDLIGWLHRTRPELFKADVHPGTWRKLWIYLGGAVGAVALMLFVILPAMANTLANYIPIEREVALGKTVMAQMERLLGARRLGDLTCTNPAGEAALEAMVTRLTASQDMIYDIEVRVFDHRMVNAFAAPGGQVVLLRGLIDAASGPDEVAGVLAHELAHVESRDATRLALRNAGSAGLLSMVLGDFTGGAALVVVGDHILNASYTRDAEGKADLFALNMLDEAGVSTMGFGKFFDSLSDMGGVDLPAYLSTHPITEERAAQAKAFARTQRGTTSVISDAEWRALQGICR